MREEKLKQLDHIARVDGSAEGRIGGLGVVQIQRLEPIGRRAGKFQRRYFLNGSETTAAALYRTARALDSTQPLSTALPTDPQLFPSQRRFDK